MEQSIFEQVGATTKIEDILASSPSRQVLRHYLMDRAKDFTAKALVGKLSRQDRREHSRLLAKRFVKSIREEQHAPSNSND